MDSVDAQSESEEDQLVFEVLQNSPSDPVHSETFQVKQVNSQVVHRFQTKILIQKTSVTDILYIWKYLGQF